MIRNIMLLTKISTINYIQNINIIDKKTNRINKKSIYFWIFIIIMIALFFISNKAITFLKRIGNVGIFINIYSVFMFLILTMQATLICPNVFYFSMITTCPLMLLFMLTYKTMPMVSFAIFAVIGFVTMFATPVTMSMAQKVLPQYKSIIGGFINGFSWGVVAIVMSIVGYVAQATSIVPVLMIISIIPAVSSRLVKYLFIEQE